MITKLFSLNNYFIAAIVIMGLLAIVGIIALLIPSFREFLKRIRFKAGKTWEFSIEPQLKKLKPSLKTRKKILHALFYIPLILLTALLIWFGYKAYEADQNRYFQNLRMSTTQQLTDMNINLIYTLKQIENSRSLFSSEELNKYKNAYDSVKLQIDNGLTEIIFLEIDTTQDRLEKLKNVTYKIALLKNFILRTFSDRLEDDRKKKITEKTDSLDILMKEIEALGDSINTLSMLNKTNIKVSEKQLKDLQSDRKKKVEEMQKIIDDLRNSKEPNDTVPFPQVINKYQLQPRNLKTDSIVPSEEINKNKAIQTEEPPLDTNIISKIPLTKKDSINQAEMYFKSAKDFENRIKKGKALDPKTLIPEIIRNYKIADSLGRPSIDKIKHWEKELKKL